MQSNMELPHILISVFNTLWMNSMVQKGCWMDCASVPNVFKC